MRTVQISDAVKDIVDRHVATGIAASEAEFLEQAVRRYAEDLDEDELVAAARAGIADIAAGNFTTITGPDSQKTFWDGVSADVTDRLAETRSNGIIDQA